MYTSYDTYRDTVKGFLKFCSNQDKHIFLCTDDGRHLSNKQIDELIEKIIKKMEEE